MYRGIIQRILPTVYALSLWLWIWLFFGYVIMAFQVVRKKKKINKNATNTIVWNVAGFRGPNCEINRNECIEDYSPCNGRGRCFDRYGGFQAGVSYDWMFLLVIYWVIRRIT